MDRAFNSLPAGDTPSLLPSFRKTWIQGMRSAWAIGRLEIRHHIACLILSAQKAGPHFELSSLPTLYCDDWDDGVWVINAKKSPSLSPLFLHLIFFLQMEWGGIAEHLLISLSSAGPGEHGERYYLILLTSTPPPAGSKWWEAAG